MKATIDRLEDVAEGLRGEYVPSNGKFILKIEGHPTGYVQASDLTEANTKLAEFRDNNRGLNSQLETAKAQLKSFEGINPAEVATLRTKVADFEKAGIKGGDDLQAKILAAVKEAVTPLEQQIATEKQEKLAAKQLAARQELTNKLMGVANNVGVDEKAVSDFVTRGANVFVNIDGKIEARNGEAPIFSRKKPAEPLSMEEWAEGLRNDAPHLFKPSRGGGAPNQPGTGGGGRPDVKKTIGSDPLEFGMNIEGIAKGEVVVDHTL